MSTTRLHHSLPAPVVHATFSVNQSKSHVLAGVQDAYWSDDEAEDAECPLCLEEMDISDLNFKPCICGYQICRFCWHHIKENLNKRCPACRRIYTDDAIEFKPIATQDHKRLTQQKKQRDRERKDLEALGRRHLANVRVVQRNVVYVVGIGPRFAKEELIPTLRSNEYFGQYGKITKILLVKRNSPGGGGPVVGLYITYHRREDAARAITAVDGTSSPGGGREVMRASYGTTKYCMSFLRGVQCGDHSCMNLHEWGDEKDCFTKEDLATLKHHIKATESRTRTITKKADEDAGLPRAASWAQKGSASSSSTNLSTNAGASIATSSTTAARQPRRTATTRPPRTVPNVAAPTTLESKPSQGKTSSDRKVNLVPSSRSSTPVVAIAEGTSTDVANEEKAVKQKEPIASVIETNTGTGVASTSQEPTAAPSRSESSDLLLPSIRPASSSQLANANAPLVPPGLPASPALPVPPGLSAPPGISSPSRPPRAETASPQTPLIASQTSYQMSTAARALLDDVKLRRESALPMSSLFSPFPDFDRTLQTLSGEDGSFSFNLDPKLADEAEIVENLPNFDIASNVPFHGGYMDAFPALRNGPPFLQSPALGYSLTNHPIYDASMARTSSGSSDKNIRAAGYLGSFNPFSDQQEASSSHPSPLQRAQHSPVDEERKVSRFGFARGRQSSNTATSSPLHSVSSLTYNNEVQPFYMAQQDVDSPHLWPPGLPDSHPSNLHPGHVMQPQTPLMFQQGLLEAVDGNLSEAQLRKFIQSSQERENNARNGMAQFSRSSQPFEDPAIMSASFVAPNERNYAYGPPPGLPVPQRMSPTPALFQAQQNSINVDGRNTFTQVPVTSSHPSLPTLLSPEDFPALAPSTSETTLQSTPTLSELETPLRSSSSAGLKASEKAERKAAKKAAAAEKALERQRLAQEKADAKAAEKKAAKEKALEKEKKEQAAMLLKSQQAKVTPQSPAESTATPTIETISSSRSEKIKSVPQVQATSKSSSKRAGSKALDVSSDTKRQDQIKASLNINVSKLSVSIPPVAEAQVPLLSKKPKKNKPIVKSVKTPREEELQDDHNSTVDLSRGANTTPDSSSSNSRSQSLDRRQTPTSVQELLAQIDATCPAMDLVDHPFFDVQRLISPAKMPLEYGPLVHALSALSVGGGSFANNMPSGSIDNAVSSFQQLLETLTQTISDLLRLLPRTTWDDSSSFDGVLRDMLKGDDFLDDGEEGPGREDEVAALTLALERRARWMEVQLSKLEELHRDINTAAVRAVLSFNDGGWDRYGFLPRVSNTLHRFDTIGLVEDGQTRFMNVDELEEKLAVAKEAAIFAETEIREAMEKMQSSRLFAHEL